MRKYSTRFRDESLSKAKRINRALWVGALGSIVVVSGLAEKTFAGKSTSTNTTNTSQGGSSNYNVTSSTLAPPPVSAGSVAPNPSSSSPSAPTPSAATGAS